ncbi:hypothetical protein NQZ68_004606 [Dissostichus eleginoides]|nr:hypothetical protein NQZ68_004606 [Dissostichus eleginoides]
MQGVIIPVHMLFKIQWVRHDIQQHHPVVRHAKLKSVGFGNRDITSDGKIKGVAMFMIEMRRRVLQSTVKEWRSQSKQTGVQNLCGYSAAVPASEGMLHQDSKTAGQGCQAVAKDAGTGALAEAEGNRQWLKIQRCHRSCSRTPKDEWS